MFLGFMLNNIVDLTHNLRVLDLSAAPGGKSTLLQSILTPDSLLVVNEVIANRNKVLHQNMIRWGGDNHIVTQSDPRVFQKLSGFFDVILVDAPCSGEGMMRKEPSALSEWSQNNVELCSARQKRILADVLPALAGDGILIYSTCTFSPDENEENMRWLATESGLVPLALDIPETWGIQAGVPEQPGYRFYPHLVQGEGLFIAAFKNSHGLVPHQQKPGKKHKNAQAPRTETANPEDKRWLATPDRYYFQTRDKHRVAFPKTIYQDVLTLAKVIRITHSGLNLGKVYHGELKPSPELALSQFISTTIPRIDLDQERALNYLAHYQFDLPKQIAPGRYLITHAGFGLGWLHVLQTGQIRNNYPSAWRILQRHKT